MMEISMPSSCLYYLILASSSLSVFGAEAFQKFLEDLGNQEFRVREEAQVELLEWGRIHRAESIDLLYKHSQTSKDPEVRERCMMILRQLVMDQFMQEGSGFIGVVRDNRIAEIPGKDNPCHVVAVNAVRAGTPAERAGIRTNDLIVSLDGVGWVEQDASTAFGNQIAALKPGTKIILSIFRDGKMIDLEVVLTRRPLSAAPEYSGGQGLDLEAADRAEMEDYFQEWLNQKKLR